jgi:TonB family protein
VGPKASSGALTPAASQPPEAESAARKARLIAEANPCGNFFPGAAAGDLGFVTLELRVTPSGTASAARILSESPGGQGFAEAARLCTSRLHFWPALDAASQPIAATSIVRLRFAR